MKTQKDRDFAHNEIIYKICFQQGIYAAREGKQVDATTYKDNPNAWEAYTEGRKEGKRMRLEDLLNK